MTHVPIKVRLYFVFIAVLIGSLIPLSIDWLGILKPKPYIHAEVLSVNTKEDTLTVKVLYKKTKAPCKITGSRFFGISYGVPTSLEYTPIRQPNVELDRTAGLQLLHWEIKLLKERAIYDYYEVRVQHTCEGSDIPVSGVMATITREQVANGYTRELKQD
jgi:hypothetical protein